MVKLAIATKHSSKLSSLWFNHLTPFSHTFIYKPNFEAGHLQCDKQRSEWSAHLLACLLVCYAARQGPAHDGVRLARPNMSDTESGAPDGCHRQDYLARQAFLRSYQFTVKESLPEKVKRRLVEIAEAAVEFVRRVGMRFTWPGSGLGYALGCPHPGASGPSDVVRKLPFTWRGPAYELAGVCVKLLNCMNH